MTCISFHAKAIVMEPSQQQESMAIAILKKGTQMSKRQTDEPQHREPGMPTRRDALMIGAGLLAAPLMASVVPVAYAAEAVSHLGMARFPLMPTALPAQPVL